MKHGEFTSKHASGQWRMFIDVMLIHQDFKQYQIQSIADLRVSAMTRSLRFTRLANYHDIKSVTQYLSAYYGICRTGFLAASDDPV
jgi:hypothetical protein